MATDHLGPFDLDIDVIEANVVRTGPGNFRLGHNDIWGQFSVRMIGRSDDDIKAELRKHALKKKYTRFTFALADTIRQAYERMCKDYHKFRGNGYLDTLKHPYAPHKHDYPCPVCKKVYRPPSEELKMDLKNTRRFSSGSNLHLVVEDEVKIDPTLKPWEIDDQGQKIRYRPGEEKQIKPWEWDHPDLVPLDEEELFTQSKNGSETEKKEIKAPIAEWLLTNETDLEPIENQEKSSEPKKEEMPIAEWLIEEDETKPTNDLSNPKQDDQVQKKDKKPKQPWEDESESE
ncbi:MAG: hypothetical protein N2450_07210 [bacterium]|nr:hypothetical protein [bacterium]